MTRPEDDLELLEKARSGVSSPGGDGAEPAAWRDTSRPVAERVDDLLRRMTLAEKAGQLRSTWLGSTAGNGGGNGDGAGNGNGGGGGVAPLQELASVPADWAELIRDGLGQLTRPFGTVPVTAREGAEALARTQLQIAAASRFGIPAIAHDECLAGFTAWTAAIFPIPLAWGASFDPQLVQEMAVQIGTSMRAVGVHQGLAPVLDVTVDPRWGRTEETIGEDPYLVATVGTGYVRGLESTGLICTLKHFVGYSASRGGRNLAPAAVTSRQIADVLLPPFEMAIRLGGARSVMHAYTDIDGIPTAADPSLLSGLLRDTWGFTGTVVADYFGISFLELLHGVAADPAQAAALALAAGVDVELPVVRCFGTPLIGAVERGDVAEALVDRAARRVLEQKCELGLLDPSWDPARRSAVSSLDPTPLYPFGHGLSYTAFSWADLECGDTRVPTDGAVRLGLTVANAGERAGTEVVQVYLHDPVAQVTRPATLLVGYARVPLEPGQRRRVEFTLHTDLTSFTGRSGQRIVEPGRIELRLGTSSADTVASFGVELTGPERTITGPRQMTADVRIS